MSDEISWDRKHKIELGGLVCHVKTAKQPWVYFKACLNTKAEQSTAYTVSQYLTTRLFLFLSKEFQYLSPCS